MRCGARAYCVLATPLDYDDPNNWSPRPYILRQQASTTSTVAVNVQKQIHPPQYELTDVPGVRALLRPATEASALPLVSLMKIGRQLQLLELHVHMHVYTQHTNMHPPYAASQYTSMHPPAGKGSHTPVFWRLRYVRAEPGVTAQSLRHEGGSKQGRRGRGPGWATTARDPLQGGGDRMQPQPTEVMINDILHVIR